MCWFFKRVYEENDAADVETVRKLREGVTLDYNLILIGFAVFASCGLGFTLFPLLTYILYGEAQLYFQIMLPFTEIKTTRGFVLNLLGQLSYVLTGFFGNTTADMLCAMIVISTTNLPILLKSALDEINDEEWDPVRSKLVFRNIIMRHKDIIM